MLVRMGETGGRPPDRDGIPARSKGDGNSWPAAVAVDGLDTHVLRHHGCAYYRGHDLPGSHGEAAGRVGANARGRFQEPATAAVVPEKMAAGHEADHDPSSRGALVVAGNIQEVMMDHNQGVAVAQKNHSCGHCQDGRWVVPC